MIDSFLKELKLLIHRRNFTQSELARELGVSAGTMSRWLSGSRQMTVKTLLDILQVLGIRDIKFS